MRIVSVIVATVLGALLVGVLPSEAHAVAANEWRIAHDYGRNKFVNPTGHTIRGLTIYAADDIDFEGVEKTTGSLTAVGAAGAYSLDARLVVSDEQQLIEADTFFGLEQHTDGLGNIWHTEKVLPDGKYQIVLKLNIPGHWACPKYDPKGCKWWPAAMEERHFNLNVQKSANTSTKASKYTQSATVVKSVSSGKVDASYTAKYTAKSTQKATVKRTVKKNGRVFSATRSAKATKSYTVKKTSKVTDYSAKATVSRTAQGTGWTQQQAKEDAQDNARDAAETAAYRLATKNAPSEAKALAKKRAIAKLTPKVKKQAKAKAKQKAKASAKKSASVKALKAAQAQSRR